MTVGVPTCKHDTPVKDIARFLLEKNVEAMCVLDAEGHGIGVVGADELVWAYAREGYETLTAEDIMSEGVPQLPPDISLAVAAHPARSETIIQLLGEKMKTQSMPIIKTFITLHPLLTYLVLTFAISWGGILAVVGPAGLPSNGDQIARLISLGYVAMLAGPGMAGILLTGILYGRTGLRELLSNFLKWRVGVRWYAASLMIAPLLILAVLLALSQISHDFLPRLFTSNDKVFEIQFSVIVGLLVGIFEELGWTGFATHVMLKFRYGVLRTGLIIGFLFALWNSLIVFLVSGATFTAGTLPMAIFLPATLFTWLPTYRVLMVWVYDRTGSLPVVMLMGASLIAFWRIFTPLTITGLPLVIYYLVVMAMLWVIIIAVLRGQTLPKPSHEKG
jgi:membrane protease YdiL (CAAX protease family)